MKAIELSDITVSYDRRPPVLSHVDLSVDYGDFVAVSGPNGGGKTTLLRVMLRLLKPGYGRVTYFSRSGHATRSLPIGYLPQKNNIDTRFPITVADTVRSGMLRGLFGRLPADADSRLAEALDTAGLTEIPDRPIGELSGGQLQRTLLARALVSRPEILVLDEPLSYVDKRFESHLYDMLGHLIGNTTVVLVSHEMTAFDRMATRRIEVDRRVISLR